MLTLSRTSKKLAVPQFLARMDTILTKNIHIFENFAKIYIQVTNILTKTNPNAIEYILKVYIKVYS